MRKVIVVERQRDVGPAAHERRLRAFPPPVGEPAAPHDWSAFEARHGFAAPADYRLLVDRHDPGQFGWSVPTGPWLYLYDPFHPERTLFDQNHHDREVLRSWQAADPHLEPPWPAWPARDGYLPWGATIDGDSVAWKMSGSPDQWGTYFYARHGPSYETDVGMLQFLFLLLMGVLEPDLPDGPLLAFERRGRSGR